MWDNCLIYHKKLYSRFAIFLYSGREAEKLAYIAKYLKAVAMFRDYNDVSQDPDFTQVSLYIYIILKF